MALGLPRAEMLERMSSAEITEWMAFMQLEPFGAETQYIGPAITSANVVNAVRSSAGYKGKQSKPDDFMPKFEQRRQEVAQMIQVAQMMTVAAGGQIGEGE